MMIGKKMRELRQTKDWTLADLSKASNIALSTLSRIETGRMTGTLESHINIARALGVRLPELYGDLDPHQVSVEVRRGSDASKKIISGKGVSAAMLTQSSLQKKMLPTLLQLEPKKSTPAEQHSAGTEKFIYLLKGQLEVTVGNEKIQLKAGDSAYFQASLSHTLKNPTSTQALALSLCAPPAL